MHWQSYRYGTNTGILPRVKQLARISVVLLLISTIHPAFASEPPQNPAPNIIYILLDDLDYYDLGVYGSPDILTETIDTIASQGMRFTNYYTNGPVCSPTRVSLLTGQYPARFGVKRAILDSSLRGIPDDVLTLPEYLHSRGYHTGHIGKWHVGTGRKEFLPSQRGYDYSVRLDTRSGLSYTDFTLNINDTEEVRSADDTFLTGVLTDYAIRFIEESVSSEPGRPFFLNLWYLAPHKPVHEIPDNYDNSRTNYCIDVGSSRKCPSPRGNYSALVTNVDRQIKRLLESLESHEGVRENTIVILTSDNGGTRRTHNRKAIQDRPLRGFKGGVHDGAIRVPFIVRWPGVVPEDSVNHSVVASFDLFPTIMEMLGPESEERRFPGESFLGILKTNTDHARSSSLFWENKHANRSFDNRSGIYNTFAVRNGDWKLVFTPSMNHQEADSLELFNIRTDQGEKRNLLSYNSDQVAGFNLFGYSVDVSNAEENDSEPTDKYRSLASDLQKEYSLWRKGQGDIKYRLETGDAGVKLSGEILEFSGGVAKATADTRLDFHDGDFSFSTWIFPSTVSGTSTIAEKPGSWKLQIDEGRLKLHMIGQYRDESAERERMLVLESSIKPEVAQHVAFTVFGWRDDPGTVRLYLNGDLVDQSDKGNSIGDVNSPSTGNDSTIFLGNDPAGRSAYHGTMSMPRLSVLSLYPSEIFSEYASRSLWEDGITGHR